MTRKAPFREVVLRQWRGRGAPGGWRYTARLLNRHGHILWQVDALEIELWFRRGHTVAAIAKGWKIHPEHVESILRLLSVRRQTRKAVA